MWVRAGTAEVIDIGTDLKERSYAREEASEFVAFERVLHQAIGRICPAWLVDSRDDLVQLALVKVMKLHRRGEGVGRVPSSYLWKVAHTTLVDEIRRRRRRREQVLDEEISMTQPDLDQPDPEGRALAGEMGQAIRWCLQQMIKPRRLAVMLHLEGHTVRETANLLGWKTKRADNLRYRGLENLRSCLESKGLRP